MIKSYIRSFLFLFFIVSYGFAQDKVDDYIQQVMKTEGIPGVSVAIVKNGQVVKVKGYGFSNVETNTAFTAETNVKIASLSKPIIAMAVMKLAEEGKLNIDDKVSKYLSNTPESWASVRIRHMLSHTSGIIRESPAFEPFEFHSDSAVVQAAYAAPLRFKTGEKYEYCNVGYFALAEVVRVVSGKPWYEYINDVIFAPTKMNSTKVNNYEEIIPNRANAYTLRNGKLYNETVFLALRPSGAFLSTVNDLVLLEKAMFEQKLLKQDSYKTMWTPFVLNDGKNALYGLGWAIEEYKETRKIRHGGSLNGFKSEFARFPDKGITIIVLTNLNEAQPHKLAEGIYDILTE